MKLKFSSRHTFLWLGAMGGLFSGAIALGAGELPTLTNTQTNITTNAVPSDFVSDGTAMEVSRLNFKITPPKGWTVHNNSAGMSLVIADRVEEKQKDGSKVNFQRNITLAAIHRPSPIDETRALELRDELTKAFSKEASISDFKILEHKFFNFHGINDGVVVYSTMKMGQFDMMQMHVLVSGVEKQFLMTYTDFANKFTKTDSGFDSAWKSMMSIQVSGDAPQRYEDLIRYGAIGGGLSLLLLAFGLIRSRQARIDYMRVADEVYADEPAVVRGNNDFTTIVDGWKLNRSKHANEMNDIELTKDQPMSIRRPMVAAPVSSLSNFY